MKIYVASSWRNEYQPYVVAALRKDGFDAYDFRASGATFKWGCVDPDWQSWTSMQFVAGLANRLVRSAFVADMDALRACDACVLVLPAGSGAHLELGWATGAGKPTAILAPGNWTVPEVMYQMAGIVTISLVEVVRYLQEHRK